MIYLVSIRDRKRNEDGTWYHKESPTARIFTVQRPFIHMSIGPFIAKEPKEKSDQGIKAYRKWLFNQLLKFHPAIEEFTEMLDVLIQEGEIILQCSCAVGKPCHGNVIKDALTWAEPFGIEGWHSALQSISSHKQANVPN